MYIFYAIIIPLGKQFDKSMSTKMVTLPNQCGLKTFLTKCVRWGKKRLTIFLKPLES